MLVLLACTCITAFATQRYTVTWVNIEHWQRVYAFAWTLDFDTHETILYLGSWPGTELEQTGTKIVDGVEYEVYTCNIYADVPPENIIFNNGLPGDGNQTADHDFTDGKEYSEMAPPENIQMNEWGYMPYSSKYSLLLSAMSGARAYCATRVTNDGKVYMERLNSKVPTRYGLFLVAEPYANIEIPTGFGIGDYYENLLKGCITKTWIAPSEDGMYRYAFMSRGHQQAPWFHEVVNEGFYSEANSAYIESIIPLATENGKEIKFLFSDGTNLDIALGVRTVQENKNVSISCSSIAGHRLTTPQRGLNII